MTSLDHPRFIAKRQAHDDRWGVFDRRRSCWPLNVPGYGVLPTFDTMVDAELEAEKLAAFYALAETAEVSA